MKTSNQHSLPDQILSEENLALKKSLAELKKQLENANQQIEWFKEQFQLIRSRQFGKQSETSKSLNLTLFDEQESDEVTETVEPIDAERERVTYTWKKRAAKKNGRNIDTSKLQREKIVHDLSDADKICSCGQTLEKIGEDSSEKIDYIPEQIKVIEHICVKYACRCCETIQTGKKPEQALPKCMATSGFISEVIIKKYDHHLPLYRQSKILAQKDIDIPDNTLGNWVMSAADCLEPLGTAWWQQIPRVHHLQADETPVKILKPDKKGFLWGYHSLDPENRFILFEFSLTRRGEVPNARLKEFSGVLQTDGYSGYNHLRRSKAIVNLGCWDHARRKFTDVIKINNANKNGLAGTMLHYIDALYKIERKHKDSTVDRRLYVRQRYSKKILHMIFKKARLACVPKKSALGKAITYLRNNQPHLEKYTDYGDTQISNCLMENQIRPFAVGRRNWLFVGNEVCANKAALFYSLIQTCKMHKIDSRKYLKYVIDKTHAMRRGEVDPVSLLPQFIDKALLENQ